MSVPVDTVSLKLGAAFTAAEAFVNTTAETRALAASLAAGEAALAELNATAAAVASFGRLEARLAETRAALAVARERADALRRGMAEAGEAAGELGKAIETATRAVQRLEAAELEMLRELRGAEAALTAAGVAVEDLAGSQVRLAQAATTARAQLAAQGEAMAGAARKTQALRLVEERLGRTLAKTADVARVSDAALAVGHAVDATGFGLAAVIGKAVEFESALADVRKVVDVEGPALEALAAELREATRLLPLGHSEIARLAASGGQLGVAAAELGGFVDLAGRVAVGFDLTAEQAGESVAKLANVFDRPVLEVEALADAVNVLGNTTAAREAQIVDVLTRIGGTGRQFGLSGEALAALAASMLALGQSPEVAASAINALLSRLQTAAVQSETFRGGLRSLGLDARTLAAEIAADPQAALSQFLDKLRTLDAQTRAEVLTQLFGVEYQDNLAALVGALDQYGRALDSVADPTRTAGALQAEFTARSDTTANQLKLTQNALNDIALTLGNALLPAVSAAAEGARGFVADHPDLASAIVGATAGTSALLLTLGTLGRGGAVALAGAAKAQALLASLSIRFAGVGARLSLWDAGAGALVARLPALALAAKGAAAGAVLVGSYKLGEALGEIAFGADAGAEASAHRSEVGDRIAQTLAELAAETGLAITDMDAFNRLVDAGAIELGEWSGKWAAVSPEVQRLRAEAERLRLGLADLGAVAVEFPPYLREVFGRLAAEIPSLRAPSAEVGRALAVLKVDVGEATRGIRTDFERLAGAFEVVAFHSDANRRAVELASANLAREVRTLNEARAVSEALNRAMAAGRISAEAAAQGAGLIQAGLAKVGERTAADRAAVEGFGATLAQVQASAAEARTFAELWSASNALSGIYQAGRLSAAEYLIEEDRLMARMRTMREQGAKTGERLAQQADQAREVVKAQNDELERTLNVRRVEADFGAVFDRYGADLGRFRVGETQGLNSEQAARLVEDYARYVRERQSGNVSLADLSQASGARL